MTSTALTLGDVSPGRDLTSYIRTVNSVPILSEERERELAYRLIDDNDLDAARELVMSHLRFVVHIARSLRGYGMPEGDLIQEGNVGLVKAVKRFDPSYGVRLVTFAVHWIKAEMHDYIVRNWRIVKVATTKAQRKLFFNLRKHTKGLNWLTSEERKAIADDLGVKPKDVATMESRLAAQDIAFDTPVGDDDDESFHSPVHMLASEVQDPADLVIEEQHNEVMTAEMQSAMEDLSDRERDILQSRWLTDEKETLHDLSARLGISAERVRQVEQDAMRKIRERIESRLALA